MATARDYIDGWFGSDATRMRRALHPDLAKHMVTGTERAPSHQSAEMLVLGTARRRGADTAPQPADSIVLLRRAGDMALVRIGTAEFVDYLQLGRFAGRWRFTNVIWQPCERS